MGEIRFTGYSTTGKVNAAGAPISSASAPRASAGNSTADRAVYGAGNAPSPDVSTVTRGGVTYEVEQRGGQYYARAQGSNVWSEPSSNALAAAQSAQSAQADVARASSESQWAVQNTRDPYYHVNYGAPGSEGGIKVTEGMLSHQPEVTAAAIRYAGATHVKGGENLPYPTFTQPSQEYVSYSPPGGIVPPGADYEPKVGGMLPELIGQRGMSPEAFEKSRKDIETQSWIMLGKGAASTRASEKANVLGADIAALNAAFMTEWGGKTELTPEEAYHYTMDRQALEEKTAPMLTEFNLLATESVVAGKEAKSMSEELGLAVAVYEGARQSYPAYQANQILAADKAYFEGVSFIPSTEKVTKAAIEGGEIGYMLGFVPSIATGVFSPFALAASTELGAIAGVGSAWGSQIGEYAMAKEEQALGYQTAPYKYTSIANVPFVGELGVPSNFNVQSAMFPYWFKPPETSGDITLTQYIAEPQKYSDYRIFSPQSEAQLAGVAGGIVGGIGAAYGAHTVAREGAKGIWEFHNIPQGNIKLANVDAAGTSDITSGQYKITRTTIIQPEPNVIKVFGKTVYAKEFPAYTVTQPSTGFGGETRQIFLSPMESIGEASAKQTARYGYYGLESIENRAASIPADYALIDKGTMPWLIKNQPGVVQYPTTKGFLFPRGTVTQTTYYSDEFVPSGARYTEVGGEAFNVPMSIERVSKPQFVYTEAASRADFMTGVEGYRSRLTPGLEYPGQFMEMGTPSTKPYSRPTGVTLTEVKAQDIPEINAVITRGTGRVVSTIDIGGREVAFKYDLNTRLLVGENIIPRANVPLSEAPGATLFPPEGFVAPAKSSNWKSTVNLYKSIASETAAKSAATPVVSGEGTHAVVDMPLTEVVSKSGSAEMALSMPKLTYPVGAFAEPAGADTASLVGTRSMSRTALSSISGGAMAPQLTLTQPKVATGMLSITTPGTSIIQPGMLTMPTPGIAVSTPEFTIFAPKTAYATDTMILSDTAVGQASLVTTVPAVAIETAPALVIEPVPGIPNLPGIVPPKIPDIIIPFGGGGMLFPALGDDLFRGTGVGGKSRGRKGGRRLPPMVNMIDVFAYEARTGKQFVHPTGAKAEAAFAESLATGGDFSFGGSQYRAGARAKGMKLGIGKIAKSKKGKRFKLW